MHYYPQYTLEDLKSGALGYGEFIYLLGGMFDVEEPEVTESVEELVARKIRDLATKRMGSR